MAEDRIVVDVDDTAIDIAIAKLKQAITLSSTATGTRDIGKATQDLSNFAAFWELTNAEIAASDFNVSDLPSLNREMRVILSQLPGMREAMRAYFTFKRLIRPISIEEGVLQINQLQTTLALLATAVLLIRWLEQRQRNIERRQLEYENFIRRERGLTHELWMNERDYWMSYLRSSPP